MNNEEQLIGIFDEMKDLLSSLTEEKLIPLLDKESIRVPDPEREKLVDELIQGVK